MYVRNVPVYAGIACLQQAAADPRGSRTCVCAITLERGGTCREEGRINVPPWYRRVGVVSASGETQGGKTGLLASVSGRHVVSRILECAQVTGKAGENGQHSGEMGCSSSWTRPSVPGCGDTSKALASSCSIQGGDPG